MMLIDLLMPARPQAARVTSGAKLSETPGWLISLAGGGPTASGVLVNEDNACNFSAVYCAVQLLSNAMRLPVGVYRRLADNAKEPARDHPIERVLRHRANRNMTGKRLRTWLQACKLLWGNGYGEIVRDRRGRVVELHPIHPRRVEPKRNAAGDVVYSIDGGKQTLAREEVFHVMGYSDDGVMGKSPISLARESIGLGLAAQDYGAQFFGNGAEPGGVIQRPIEAADLDEMGEQELIASWMRAHGRGQRHVPAILHEGAEWKNTGMPHKDAEFLETRKLQVVEIARWFGAPPHMLMDLERATFSNIEHQAISFVVYSLAHHLDDFTDEASFSLFTPAEGDEYFVEFNHRGLLQGDHQARSAFYKVLWEMGVLSINEIRALESMNPVEGGNQRFVQTSYTTLDQVGQAAPASGAGSPPARAAAASLATSNLLPVFVVAADRLHRKRLKALGHAQEKYAADQEAFEAWSNTFHAGWRAELEREYLAPAEALARMAGGDVARALGAVPAIAALQAERARRLARPSSGDEAPPALDQAAQVTADAEEAMAAIAAVCVP